MSGCLRRGTQKHVNSLHDIILLRVVWVFLARNLQDSWNGRVIILQNVSDAIGNVLINENNSNILPLGEIPKGRLHLCELCVRLHNQKVAGVRRSVTDSS